MLITSYKSKVIRYNKIQVKNLYKCSITEFDHDGDPIPVEVESPVLANDTEAENFPPPDDAGLLQDVQRQKVTQPVSGNVLDIFWKCPLQVLGFD